MQQLLGCVCSVLPVLLVLPKLLRIGSAPLLLQVLPSFAAVLRSAVKALLCHGKEPDTVPEKSASQVRID